MMAEKFVIPYIPRLEIVNVPPYNQAINHNIKKPLNILTPR